MGVEHLDALIVGGNVRGLVTAWLLGQLGLRAVLVERAPFFGGADASFRTPWGDRFEFGMHVLDELRSPLATRVFQKVVGAHHRVLLERGMILRGHVVPYAPRREDLPGELAAMLPEGPLVDDLGAALPTRARLGAIYGPAWADFVFDEILPSYPTEVRHQAFGVPEEELLANVYPWFFPRAKRLTPEGSESRAFHDRLRNGVPQHVLYPAEGGFGGFAEGLVRQARAAGVELLAGVQAEVVVEPGSHRVAEVRVGERVLRAPTVFWAGGWPALCATLGLPCQDPATDRVVIGSLRLDRPSACAFHELLVGDPSMLLNRVTFPARFRGSDEPLVQLEYAFPEAERDRYPGEAGAWAERWLADLRRAGVLEADHRVEHIDLKSVQIHFNGYGMEGERLVDADPALLVDSNVHPVVPSMANLNLNNHLPRTIRDVAAVLAAREG